MQLDGCPPQKIATERYLGWVDQQRAKYPKAKIYSRYKAGPCGYWLHRKLAERGVRNYVVAPVALNRAADLSLRAQGALKVTTSLAFT